MKKRLGKAFWYLGLGYLTTLLGTALGMILSIDSFWSYGTGEWVRETWYQTLGTYFVSLLASQIYFAPYLIVVSAVIGAVLFCFTVLVKKVSSVFKSGV